MHGLAAAAGIAIIVAVLWEAFDRRPAAPRHPPFPLHAPVLPCDLEAVAALLGHVQPVKRRESYLSYFGPLSLLGLLVALGRCCWYTGFALLHWASRPPAWIVATPGLPGGFWTDLYMSGTTFFTLGLGNVTPRSPLARFVT